MKATGTVARASLAITAALLAAGGASGCGGSPSPVAQAPAPPATATPTASKPVASAEPTDDDLLYLEEVDGQRSLAFARAHNTISEGELTAAPGFRALESRLLAVHGSKDKIPAPQVVGNTVRNFWTDGDHPRGILRTTSFADFKKPSPAWTTILDIDALNKAENESFVYHGMTCLYPREVKCLVRLSRGGGDAEIVREFDVEKKAFVKGGFELPQAKLSVSWKDENTIYVGTDFGPGSMSKAGYPRISKEWKRGTPLASAKTVFEAQESDLGGSCGRSFTHGRAQDVCSRAIDFERQEVSLLQAGKLVRIDVPDDANVVTWDDDLFVRLRSDWRVGDKTYAKGSLLAAKLTPFLAGKRDFQVLFEPTAGTSLKNLTTLKSKLVINVLADVKSKISIFTRKTAAGPWTGTPLDETAGSIQAGPVDDDNSDDVWLWTEDFTVPNTLSYWNTTTGKREVIKRNPSFFEATGLDVSQHFATSKDGTKVPYFEVRKKGETKPGPTLLSAYGGFEISMTPTYGAARGVAWLERGGTFVLANLRGGGEYGPEWHKAAIKEKRQNAYDDLAAVAEDLTRRGVATPKTLGVIGGSNGGLLTSVMLTQRPELFGAIVSMVPLTDMKRYHKLLAGASWMSEYGDPENAQDWAALAKFSPLHNTKRGVAYPPVLYTTSTKDDRVHPGHARKMVARLEAEGYKPLYYENIEGGHGGAADLKQRAYVDALVYTFLASRLGLN